MSSIRIEVERGRSFELRSNRSWLVPRGWSANRIVLSGRNPLAGERRSPSPSIQGLPNELVSNSMNRQDVARIRWGHLQFVPEFGDVVVHRAGQRKHIVAPYLCEQLIAGYDLSFMENQESQCFKFTR